MKNNAKKYISILYSTPFGVLLIIFALSPFVLNLAVSFTNYGLMRQDWNFVGIKNYVDILSDEGGIKEHKSLKVKLVENVMKIYRKETDQHKKLFYDEALVLYDYEFDSKMSQFK